MFNYPREYFQLPSKVCLTTLGSMFNYPGEYGQLLWGICSTTLTGPWTARARFARFFRFFSEVFLFHFLGHLSLPFSDSVIPLFLGSSFPSSFFTSFLCDLQPLPSRPCPWHMIWNDSFYHLPLFLSLFILRLFLVLFSALAIQTLPLAHDME